MQDLAEGELENRLAGGACGRPGCCDDVVGAGLELGPGSHAMARQPAAPAPCAVPSQPS